MSRIQDSKCFAITTADMGFDAFGRQYGAMGSGLPSDGYTPSYQQIDGYAVTASFTSAPFSVQQTDWYSVVVSGLATGTVAIQACNDRSTTSRNAEFPDDGLQNWITLKFYDGTNQVSLQTLAGGQPVIFEEDSCTYRWIRLVYTKTASGSMKAAVQYKVLA
jgi:hypothetical protein